MLKAPLLIEPDWPAPANVKALQTTRLGGVSLGSFKSLNLGGHVADNELHVEQNRRRLAEHLPSLPLWLQQVHGTAVVNEFQALNQPEADGAYTKEINQVCAVMTADCLPVLFCNESGTQVAAVHAGWRGLAAGILEKTLNTFDCKNEAILVWLGPAIGPNAFEVGLPVYDAFCQGQAEALDCFKKLKNEGGGGEDKWHADLYSLARLRLKKAGIQQIYGGEECTFTNAEHFFSYRRDGETGRMATCIWLQE